MGGDSSSAGTVYIKAPEHTRGILISDNSMIPSQHILPTCLPTIGLCYADSVYKNTLLDLDGEFRTAVVNGNSIAVLIYKDTIACT